MAQHVTPRDTARTAIDATITLAYHVGIDGDVRRRAIAREHLMTLVNLADVDDGVKREMLAQIDAVLRTMAVTRELAAGAL